MKKTLFLFSLGFLIFGLVSILAETIWPGLISLTYDNRLWFLLSLTLSLLTRKYS